MPGRIAAGGPAPSRDWRAPVGDQKGIQVPLRVNFI